MSGAINLSRREALAALGGGGLGVACAVQSKAVTTSAVVKSSAAVTSSAAVILSRDIDSIVRRFMAAFEIPGVAVAIVTPTAPPLVRGYGVRTIGSAALVDVHTRFAIASNTKAFTAALIAVLVDEGRVKWDDPVIRHLPEFRMSDPAVTGMFTIRDLLVHRSGLSLGAGDLLFFPASAHPATKALQALPFLPLSGGFRCGFAYDNILYIVAGLMIERVTGRGWRDLVASRLLGPLGMQDAVPSRLMLDTSNVAGRHARLGPPLRGMGALATIPANDSPAIDAAGGINASASDMACWIGTQLRRGRLPDGGRLWSEARSDEMWSPQTIVVGTTGPDTHDPTRAVTTSYALGWVHHDYRGTLLLSHGGGLDGQVTHTALLPAHGSGLVILTNCESGAAEVLRNALLDRLLDAPAFEWVDWYRAESAQADRKILATLAAVTTRPVGGPSLSLVRYTGRYRDPWYGDIVVSLDATRLRVDFEATPALKGALEPWGLDTFRSRFPLGVEDVLIHFEISGDSANSMQLQRWSPEGDFSYDYQDLAPIKT